MTAELERLVALWQARVAELEAEALDHERAARTARAQAERLKGNLRSAGKISIRAQGFATAQMPDEQDEEAVEAPVEASAKRSRHARGLHTLRPDMRCELCVTKLTLDTAATSG